jgi:hypothetical protein
MPSWFSKRRRQVLPAPSRAAPSLQPPLPPRSSLQSQAPPAYTGTASTSTSILDTLAVEDNNVLEEQAQFAQPANAPNSTEQHPDRKNYGGSTDNDDSEHESDEQEPVFLTLPKSVLLRINRLLPPESQAALALVNKSTLSVLGHSGHLVKSISPESRQALLQLLDRDLYFLVYCAYCKIIHHPLAIPQGGRCRISASIIPDKEPEGARFSQYCITTPCFNYVHALMRNCRAGRDYTELQQLAGGVGFKSDMELKLRRGAIVKKIKVVRGVGGGSCITMWQKIFPVLPAVGGISTIRNMYEIGWYVRWSARICNHRRWNTEYQFLLPNIANLAVKSDHYVRKDNTEKFAAFALDPRSFCAATKALPNTKHITGTFDSRLHCALFHHSGCSCGANIQWGVVRSCDRCDTDFCFTVVTQGVPGKPKEESFWVFTSWRNWGAGVLTDDPVWQAQVSNSIQQQPSNHARPSGLLWPYSQFRQLYQQSNEYGPFVYRPSLQERSILSARAYE